MSPDAASPDDAVDTPPRRLDRPAMAVVLLIVAVFGLAQGLTYPLLSFILERQGLPAWLIGANAAMMACGLLVSAPLIPGLAARHGAARLALVAALSLALACVFAVYSVRATPFSIRRSACILLRPTPRCLLACNQKTQVMSSQFALPPTKF
mgnify:CR=1 FL=1